MQQQTPPNDNLTQAVDKLSTSTIPVWDLGVRLFHWGWVLSISGAYLVSELDGDRDLHEWLGYTAMGLLLFRVIWGFIGGTYARFAQFWPKPSILKPYVADLLRGREKRHIGHNPAGSVMVFALLAIVAGIGTSGWLMTTDWGWGSEVLEEIHETLVNILILCVFLHVGAVIVESLRHGESLVKAMITGKKRR